LPAEIVRGECWQEAGSSAHLEEAGEEFPELTAGREIEYEGQPTRISWAGGSRARLGLQILDPKVLDLAGKDCGRCDFCNSADPADCVVYRFRQQGAEARDAICGRSRSCPAGGGVGFRLI